MTISTLDGALAGMQIPQPFIKTNLSTPVTAAPQSYWAAGGNPGAGSFNSTLNGGVYSSSSALVPGQLPHYDPVSGNAYLGRFSVTATVSGLLMLCDRLWDNGGISATSTAAQNITSPTWPARDANGATAGAGVLLGVEISAAMGAATPTVTVSYTNSAGTAGQTGSATDLSHFRFGGSVRFCLHPRSLSTDSSRAAAKPQRRLTGRRPGSSSVFMPQPPAWQD